MNSMLHSLRSFVRIPEKYDQMIFLKNFISLIHKYIWYFSSLYPQQTRSRIFSIEPECHIYSAKKRNVTLRKFQIY